MKNRGTPLRRSRLARRLVGVFVLLIAVPLLVAVLVLGRAGREQIVWTARTLEQINHDTVAGAGKNFERLGGQALGRSSERTSAISLRALRSARGRMERTQNDALGTTAREVEAQTRQGFDETARQSLQTNRATLGRVNQEMAALFARSSRQAQKEAGAHVQRAMLDVIGNTLQERAERLALQVTQHVQAHANYLHLAAQIPALQSPSERDQKAVVDALVRRWAMFTTVSVLDAGGRETALAAPDRVLTAADRGERAGEDYFRAALKGETFLHPDGVDANGAPVLRLAVPIEAYRGKVVGVLAARLSLADLWDTVRSARVGEKGFACVLDARGRFLLAPPPPPAAVLAAAPASATPPQTGAPAPPPLVPLLRRAAVVPGLNWRVVAARPQSEVMQPIRALENDIQQNTRRALGQMRRDISRSGRATEAGLRQSAGRIQSAAARRLDARAEQAFAHLRARTAQQMNAELVRMQNDIQAESVRTQRQSRAQMASATGAASRQVALRVPPLTARALGRANARLTGFAAALLGASCLIGSLVALLLARRIVRPVVQLAQNTRAIADGDLSGRVEDDNLPDDEIGDLARAFNTMAGSLQQSRAELEGAQAQLVQSAKLASLGTLSAGVAHELNQPVAIIRGLAQQLQDEPDLPPFLAEDLQLIEGQTTRMIKIIQHLRTFSRVGGADRETLDPNAVVRDCFILISAQLTAHNISVDLDLCENDGVAVVGEANELEQVFLNLITNARDALDGRNDARISIRSHVNAERYVIAFADNGPGVPADLAARVFDPFFTTKEPGKGTGLGLSISHGIIEKMGGQVALTNDHGAVFTITLPLAAAQTEETLQSAAAAGSLSSLPLAA